MIKVFRLLLVIIWMLIIFSFSQSSRSKSGGASVGIIKDSIVNISKVLTKIKVVKKPLSNMQADKIARKLNYPARKVMHMSEFFILALLIYNYLVLFKIKQIYFVTFIASFIYAITDEIHQLFTGRACSIIDILVDSIGIILAIIFIYNVNKIKSKKA